MRAGSTSPNEVRAGDPARHRIVAGCVPDRGNRPRRRRWGGRRGETRVRSFAILPPSGPETEREARGRCGSARPRWWSGPPPATIARSMVSPGSYESMRAEAIGALDAAGVETRGVWVDIAPAARTAASSGAPAGRRHAGVGAGADRCAAAAGRRRHSRPDGDDAGRRAQFAGAAATRLLDAGRDWKCSSRSKNERRASR